jgi:hypothetical protein
MRTTFATLSIVVLSLLCLAAPARAEVPFSKEVQKACGKDYHKYCSEYGLETMALRSCMDKAGHSLSHACIHALIRAGEVSQAEVNRRKKAGR